MSAAGYGRGYYGENQLVKDPPRRSSVWFKIALVVGAGAVIWYVWRRRSAARTAQLGPEFGLAGVESLSSQAFPSLEWQRVQPQFAQPAFAQPQFVPSPQLTPSALPVSTEPQVHHAQIAQQLAQSRGYPSMKEYEDAIVASARQLQDSGTRVVLAPHLAHLAPRLGS
jgi:hypothetical protein